MYKKKEAISEKEGEKFKSQLIPKGYGQEERIDYNEIFF